MSAYGSVAVDAVLRCHKWAADPVLAWAYAAQAAFPGRKSMQSKSCPRGAFLGLCAADLIPGVPTKEVDYHPGLNAAYAVRAVDILRQKGASVPDRKALWQKVIGRGIKAHNGQMDVVLALWDRKLIKGT